MRVRREYIVLDKTTRTVAIFTQPPSKLSKQYIDDHASQWQQNHSTMWPRNIRNGLCLGRPKTLRLLAIRIYLYCGRNRSSVSLGESWPKSGVSLCSILSNRRPKHRRSHLIHAHPPYGPHEATTQIFPCLAAYKHRGTTHHLRMVLKS